MKAALVLVVVLAAIVGCRHRDGRTPPAAPAAVAAPEDDARGDAGIRLPPGHPALAPSVTKQPGDVQL